MNLNQAQRAARQLLGKGAVIRDKGEKYKPLDADERNAMRARAKLLFMKEPTRDEALRCVNRANTYRYNAGTIQTVGHPQLSAYFVVSMADTLQELIDGIKRAKS